MGYETSFLKIKLLDKDSFFLQNEKFHKSKVSLDTAILAKETK